MKTSLHFEAPNDLSVGTVRITGEGKTVADWVATPDNRTFSQEDLKPGIYSAEIGPAGVPPQSVVFWVQEGQANNVVLPSFSALSASGSNTSFFDHESLRTTSTPPQSISERLFAEVEFKAFPDSEFLSQLILDEPEMPPQPGRVSAESRRFSVGLSEEVRGRDAFDTFHGLTNMEVFPGRIEVELPTDPGRDRWAGHRVRLSVAVQRLRVERCLLPLYAGGTRITATVPPLSAADVELTILPIDAKLRSLLRALDAGTSAEAAAVRDDVIGKGDPSAQPIAGGDPWATILSALLPIRFSDVFSPLSAEAIERLMKRASWSYDAHVVHANHLLASADDAKPEMQEKAVEAAITALVTAQVAGSPYYRYANQLFSEMVSGIDAYLGNTKHGITPPIVDRFNRAKARWRREIPLQRGAGPTFTWLARDQAALKERRVLMPNTRSSGRLRSRDCTILFEGRVSNGQIAIISEAGGQSAAEEIPGPEGVVSRQFQKPEADNRSIPSFARPPGPRDNPNKGRFGGTAERDGFRLSAAFERGTDRSRVLVQLTVEADSSAKISLGDFAWFFLHPTFSPSMLKVAFRGNRARLRIQAWRGFNVGVWLPGSNVELECDLSAFPDAPAIIRDRPTMASSTRESIMPKNCVFSENTLTFVGTPVEQARCLLRTVKRAGNVDDTQATIPEILQALLSSTEHVGITVARLRQYLAGHGIPESSVGGNLDRPVSRANSNADDAPLARYFIIHDTSTKLAHDQTFDPNFINTNRWSGNSISSLERGKTHIYITRTGETMTDTDYQTAWRATRFELRDTKYRGLCLHHELVQPRMGPGRSDVDAPMPGFTQMQYERLSLQYIIAAVRRGQWMIPAFHCVLDIGIGDHDDPQNFDMAMWGTTLKAMLDAVSE